MDYCKIGEKVRKYRKAKGLSQEQLAERVGISVTHMSHIETGNTKLSLQVLIDLAKTLEVLCDDLLNEQPNGKSATLSQIEELFSSCSAAQTKVILDVIRATKVALDKHL